MNFYAKFLFLGKIEGMARLQSAPTIVVITILIIGDRAICQSTVGPCESSALILSNFNNLRLIPLQHLNRVLQAAKRNPLRPSPTPCERLPLEGHFHSLRG